MTAKEFMLENLGRDVVIGTKEGGKLYFSDWLVDFAKLKCKEQRELCRQVYYEYEPGEQDNSDLAILNAAEPEL